MIQGTVRLASLVFLIGFFLIPQIPAQLTSLQRNKDNAADSIKEGKDLIRSRQYEKAAEVFRQVLSQQPDSAVAEAHLSLAVLLQGRPGEALTLAQKAIEMDANYPYAYVALGNANQAMNRFAEAIEAFKQAIHLKPDYFEPYVGLGSLYGQTRRYEESLDAFTKAQQLNANNADVYNGLAIAYYRLGKAEEAIANIKKAVSIQPNFVNAYINLGNWYDELGRYEEAVDAYSQVIRLAPKFPSGYFHRSLFQMYLGHGSEAADDARTFLGVADWYRDRSPYMVILATLGFQQAGREADAAKTLELAAKRCNTSAWPYPVIRYLRQEITAPELLSQATNNDLLTEAHAYIGMAMAVAGKREEAMKQFKWVKENGNKTFIEYKLALLELVRITKTK